MTGVDEHRVAFGDALREEVGRAHREVVLIAPFIKAPTLARLVEPLADGVKLVCVTRWRPEEIATGVSDTGAYDVVTQHGGTMWLRQDLHAKYYRCDSLVRVGSANLTNAALGWAAEPNLELMVPVTADADWARQFEEIALRCAVHVDRDLYETVTAMLAGWRTERERIEPSDSEVGEDDRLELGRWMPLTREPADLYQVYLDPGGDGLPSATREAGVRDLAVLHPPRGLTEREFDVAIAVNLVAMPMVNCVDQLLSTPQRFGTLRSHLRQELGVSQSDATRLCQTLVRWLRYFLGSRYQYQRPGHSEVMGRRSAESAVSG